MHKSEYIVAMVFCLGIISLSTFFIVFSDNVYHEIIHVLALFGTIFLAGLSFKAFYTYRIVRMLCAAFAFLLFGGAEGLEIIEDFGKEEHKEYDSIAEIRDYFIILGIGVFALGTIPSKNK
jgi:Ca2+/Na+ antiporter